MAAGVAQLDGEQFEKTGISSISERGPTEAVCPRCRLGKLSYIGKYLGRGAAPAGWCSKASSVWVYKLLCSNNKCGIEFHYKENT